MVAIYYFYREYHMATHNGEYSGEYDNLLFFFVHMFHRIQDEYAREGPMKMEPSAQ